MPTHAPGWLHVLAAPFESRKVEGSRPLNVLMEGRRKPPPAPRTHLFTARRRAGRGRSGQWCSTLSLSALRYRAFESENPEPQFSTCSRNVSGALTVGQALAATAMILSSQGSLACPTPIDERIGGPSSDPVSSCLAVQRSPEILAASSGQPRACYRPLELKGPSSCWGRAILSHP